MRNHILISLIVIFTFFIWQGFLSIVDGFLMAFLSMPLFYAIYYVYKNLSKNLFYKISQIILLPLIVSIPIPALMFYYAIQKDDRWLGLGAAIVSGTAFLLYVVNEVYLIWNLRKRSLIFMEKAFVGNKRV